MSTKQRVLTKADIAAAYSAVPAIISPATLAEMIGVSRKTVYGWIAHGRLEGSFRKRGKHTLIWKQRALESLFNGPDWKNGEQA